MKWLLRVIIILGTVGVVILNAVGQGLCNYVNALSGKVPYVNG